MPFRPLWIGPLPLISPFPWFAFFRPFLLLSLSIRVNSYISNGLKTLEYQVDGFLLKAHGSLGVISLAEQADIRSGGK
jgi:hypothetical protein